MGDLVERLSRVCYEAKQVEMARLVQRPNQSNALPMLWDDWVECPEKESFRAGIRAGIKSGL